VAAIAEVPATKLLGTSPKGFNATGEYEESSYHEFLESIQEHDLTPLLNRHYELLLRSEIWPKHGVKFNVSVSWNELDAMTAEEQAMVQKLKAERDVALSQAGAIDGQDIRDRIIKDPDSEYSGIDAEVPEIEEDVPSDAKVSEKPEQNAEK
jgi:hypothetical protein